MSHFLEKICRTQENIIKVVKKDLTYFTPSLAFIHGICALPLHRKPFSLIEDWAYKKKHEEILLYLNKTYGAELKHTVMQLKEEATIYNSNELPIWVCWLQGEENAPPLVRCCIASIKKHAGNHPVHIIAEKNLGSYVELPSIIYEKKKSGIIEPAQFSDIIRVSLLEKFGGLWIDATVFCTQQIPDGYFEYDLFSCKGPIQKGKYVSGFRWTSFIMGGKPGSLFFKLMKDLFYTYWEKEECRIDYLLIDYFIELLYRNVPSIKDTIDLIPENNLQRDEMAAAMNSAFSLELWEKFINSKTIFYKLSWRENWKEKTCDGAETLFKKFIHGKE